jgi:hypothetical protein
MLLYIFSTRSPKNIDIITSPDSESENDSETNKTEDFLDFDTDFLMVTVKDEYDYQR